MCIKRRLVPKSKLTKDEISNYVWYKMTQDSKHYFYVDYLICGHVVYRRIELLDQRDLWDDDSPIHQNISSYFF